MTTTAAPVQTRCRCGAVPGAVRGRHGALLTWVEFGFGVAVWAILVCIVVLGDPRPAAIAAGAGALLLVGTATVVAVRGHRGWCWAGRTVWWAVAGPGAILEFLAW